MSGATKRAANLSKARRRPILKHLPILLIAAAAGLVMLANLGNEYLWQDEAQTALVGKTVLAHGIPLATDGKNSFSQEQGKDSGPGHVWLWHPWFQFYLVAGSFALFGANTFAARLPFALLGMATIILTYYFALALFGSRRVAFVAALMLLLSVPFMLLARQCRYYAPDAFFCLLGLYGYLGLLQRRRSGAVVLLVSATLVFHSHYVQSAALLATVCLHSLIWRRDRLLTVVLVCAGVAVVNLPFIIWFSRMARAVSRPGNLLAWSFFVARDLLGQMRASVFPPLMLAPALLVVGVSWARQKRFPRPERKALEGVSLLVLFAAVTLAMVSPTAPGPFFRYLAPMIPLSCLAMALIVESSIRINIAIGIAIIAIYAYAGTMSQYLYEITHDYNGPIEGICRYLNAHARPTDTVVITYGDLPLKFYTKLRVLGGLTGEDLAPAAKAEWVIVRKHIICRRDYTVYKYLADHLNPNEYEPIVIDYPDIAFENREEPRLHYYRTATDADPVTIFKRIKT